jgi:predicted acylesterase/phospholipase RssA
MTDSNEHLFDIVERYFGIGAEDAKAFIDEFTAQNVAGGHWLFRQGEHADALYFLVRGRLQVWIEPDAGKEDQESRLVGEITPGECVGEIGLLTGGVRTAGIRAIRDSQLLKLDRQAFEHFAVKHPNLVMQLAGSIARRLTERTRHAPDASRNLTTIALLPLDKNDWLPDFCERLTGELRRRVSTLCLTSDSLGKCGAPVDSVSAEEAIPDSLRHWLDDQENEHRLLLYVADPGDTSWSRFCLRQSDIVFLLADAERDAGRRDWEKKLLDAGDAATARRALLLRHSASDARIENTLAWLTPRDVKFHLHLRAGHRDESGRISRVLLGDAIGLVLGGGAARGFAEIGAYRAIYESGVPIDWVGGTSIGGIIGAAIAKNLGPDYVLEASREAFVVGKPFGDYTLPLISLLRGKRMERLTQKHLHGEIEDLPTPFFCVSTMLDSGDLHIHERGPIWQALRATAALPGMLPPAVIQRRLVVDGAVINNLPVDIMRDKVVGRVIAIDVSSRRTYTVDYDEIPSPWALIAGRLLPGRKRYRVPGVISVLMKSAEIGTAAKMRELAASADLLLRPPVDQFGITDVNSFDKIVQAGYDYTREHLDKWLSADEKAVSRGS